MARTRPAKAAERGPALRLQVATRAGRVPAATRVRRWLVAAGAPPGATVTVRFVGYPESGRLNAAYRGKQGPTNVLAFPAGPQPPGAERELGDLVLCLPLAAREARQQEKKAEEHLAHLVVHGTLHLLGHDHGHEAEARRMENKEVRILARLGIGNPYRAPSPARRPDPRRKP